jgi:4-hydroxybenzoate polyprenyltransferase
MKMKAQAEPVAVVPDTEYHGLTRWMPAQARPFVLLARFDRPAGWMLLYWPCAFGVLLAGGVVTHWPLLLWFLIGSIAMRGAGCVYNDIIDRKLDAQIERTRDRPLASGSVSVRAAWIWLVLLSLIGLVVLLQLPAFSALIAVASLALVAAYPFMKRITWWPQAWLGLVFSWGAPVGWTAVTGELNLALICLYGGCVAWVIGYDTIYALQDIEDDAAVGVRSSARALGQNIGAGVITFYLMTVIAWSTAFWLVRPDWIAELALLPLVLHLCWQALTLDVSNVSDALRKFRSNRVAGALMALACLVVGTASL